MKKLSIVVFSVLMACAGASFADGPHSGIGQCPKIICG